MISLSCAISMHGFGIKSINYHSSTQLWAPGQAAPWACKAFEVKCVAAIVLSIPTRSKTKKWFQAMTPLQGKTAKPRAQVGAHPSPPNHQGLEDLQPPARSDLDKEKTYMIVCYCGEGWIHCMFNNTISLICTTFMCQALHVLAKPFAFTAKVDMPIVHMACTTGSNIASRWCL